MPRTPTISVRGVGNVSVPPDRTVVSFTLSTIDKDYAQSANELNERVARLRSRLKKSGIDPADLKTTRFAIEPKHEWRGKGQSQRHVFLGWVTKHNMRLELPIDRDRLNKAFAAIASDEVQSELSIRFEVSDADALRTKILEEATRVACRNAEAMAKAAGCKLGKALKISYDWSEIQVRSKGWDLMHTKIMSMKDAAPDIEPEEVKAQDSVQVLFELV